MSAEYYVRQLSQRLEGVGWVGEDDIEHIRASIQIAKRVASDDLQVVDFELDEIGSCLSQFECVVAARSGLVDLIAALPIPQVVLYPQNDGKHDWGVGSCVQAWGMEGHCAGPLVELEFSDGGSSETVERVVDAVERLRVEAG